MFVTVLPDGRCRLELLVLRISHFDPDQTRRPTSNRKIEIGRIRRPELSKTIRVSLWQRFRAAQERFFSHRSATFSSRDSESERNVTRKQELVAAAERIDPAGDIEAARAQLRSIQERWEAVGKIPRERVKELEAAIQKFK